jgi:hypothetical protein
MLEPECARERGKSGKSFHSAIIAQAVCKQRTVDSFCISFAHIVPLTFRKPHLYYGKVGGIFRR